jgi:hypothetical protein
MPGRLARRTVPGNPAAASEEAPATIDASNRADGTGTSGCGSGIVWLGGGWLEPNGADAPAWGMTDGFTVLVRTHVGGDVNPEGGGGAENFADGSQVAGGNKPILVVVRSGGCSTVEDVVVGGGRTSWFLGKGKRKTRLRSVTRPDGSLTW